MSRGAAATMELRLDHASVEVPNLADAVRRLDRLLGLRVTVSPQAPERHGRIYLDRAYLEVAADPDVPAWEVTHFFLRFSDPTWLRAHLDGAGLGYRYQVYRGVDGRWDDIELDIGDVPVPILVRRTAPAAVARDWPPPLGWPHRCGAFTLAAVHIPVASIQQAAGVYARLLGVALPRVVSGPGPGQLRTAFDLGSGSIVLREGAERRAVVLGVASLELSRTALSQVLLIDDDGVAWLDPSTTSNLRIGLVETRSITDAPVGA
jgi:catechol 2,3-dioxygenase-like lactoylglutathione lyase family enzyme